MAVAPPLIAVRFTRQTRDATTKALGGAPRAVTAVPSVGRLTKAADRGFYDLHGWEVTPQSSDGSGILLLEATDANDESWGWTITLAGEVTSKLVSVPSSPSGGVSAGNVTVDGTSYPAVWLTSLATFTLPQSGSGADLAAYAKTADMNAAIASAVTALKAEADPFLQYASNAELDTEITQRGQAVATRAPLLTERTTAATSATTAAANEIVPVNTSSGTFPVTGPTAGGMFGVRWKAGTAAPTVVAPTVGGTQYTIAGQASVTMGLPPSGASSELVVWFPVGTDYQPLSGFKGQAALQAALQTLFDARYPVVDQTGAAQGAVVAVAGTNPTSYKLVAAAPTPQLFGAKGDGTTDDTAALATWLASGASIGRLPATPNGYKITATLTQPVGMKVVFEQGAFLKAGAAINGPMWDTPVGTMSRNKGLYNAYFDCAGLAQTGLYVRYAAHFELPNLTVLDATGDSVIVGDPAASSWCYEPIITNLNVFRTQGGSVPAGSRGLYLNNCTDGEISIALIVGADIGIRNEKGGHRFSHAHVWGFSGACPSICFDDNASGVQWFACYADTPTAYGWRLRKWGSVLTACRQYLTTYGVDNTVVGVMIDQAASGHMITDMTFDGVSPSTIRYAKDFDGQVSGASIRGSVVNNVVAEAPKPLKVRTTDGSALNVTSPTNGQLFNIDSSSGKAASLVNGLLLKGFSDLYNNETLRIEPSSGAIQPGTLNGGRGARIYSGTGAPSGGLGVDGDIYIRKDPPIAGASQSVYQRLAGTWKLFGPIDALSLLNTGEETMPRLAVVNSGIAISTGRLQLTYFTARKDETINNVVVRTGGTAAAATPTLCRIGIYEIAGSNGDGTLVASCANDTALFSATFTTYTKALSAPLTKVAGKRYAMGILVVSGAATPTFYGNGSIVDPSAQPRICSGLSGNSDLPATFLDSGLSASGASLIYGTVTP